MSDLDASPPPRSLDPGARHLYEAERREDLAVDRWLFLHAEELLGALGLGASWWCGLRLSRARVLGDPTLDGDLDIVAGNLRFDLTQEQADERWAAERARWRPTAHPSVAWEAMLRRAAAEGALEWPPLCQPIVACEAKASWFDADADQLKRSHAGKGNRIMGQLKVPLQRGLDRVAYLHLSSTKPHLAGDANPWIAALAAADGAANRLPQVFDPAEVPGVGYFWASVGAVSHKTEELAGAGGALQVLTPAEDLPAADPSAPWRTALQDALGAFPRPPIFQLFVKECVRCGAWRLHDSSLGQCPCPA